MFKFKWIWVPEAVMVISGASLMAVPFFGPMSDMAKFLFIFWGFVVLVVGLSLEEIVNNIKKSKENNQGDE